MADVFVSWLMPVYNAEIFLDRAFNSILNQTYQHFEIIVIIEYGCTDNTSLICNEYAAKDNRIKIHYNKEHLGIAKSLNVGLDLCRGDYIARMDADDFSYPERLEKQVSHMEKNPDVGILLTSHRSILDNGNVHETILPDNHEEIKAGLLFRYSLNHSSMLLRASLFKANNWKYPEYDQAEDYALCVMLMDKTKIVSLTDVLMDCYYHDNNATYFYFDEGRIISVELSRQAIGKCYDMDLDEYGEMHFGWFDYEMPPYDKKAYLIKEIQLLREVEKNNILSNKFSAELLKNVLQKQWIFSIHLARLYHFLGDTIYSEVSEEHIEAALVKDEIYYTGASVVVYGTGKHTENIMQDLYGRYPFNINYFCDSDTKKQGTNFFGKPVYPPQKLKECDYDYIFIASPLNETAIRASLRNLEGVPQDKIMSLPPNHVLDLKIRQSKYELYYAHENNSKKVYLFGAPDYANLGDHAIAEAEHKFFKDTLSAKVYEIPQKDYKLAKNVAMQHISPSDLIVVTGGGFLGSLWFDAERQVRDIIKTFSNNPIVIMPQTLYWENTQRWQKECKKTQRIYAAHPNLTFCARDKKTQQLVKELYPSCHVILAPDMVLYNDWKDWLDDSQQRRGALICLKNDKESILSEEIRDDLQLIGKKLCGTAFDGNTDLLKAVSLEERESALRAKLNDFRAAELVITDRLHGLIFAAVTETPCVALNNVNHKLRETFEWVKHLPYLRFAKGLDTVEDLARQVIFTAERNFDSLHFKSYFNDLENLILRR